MTTISEAAAARIAVDAFTEGLVAALTAKNTRSRGTKSAPSYRTMWRRQTEENTKA